MELAVVPSPPYATDLHKLYECNVVALLLGFGRKPWKLSHAGTHHVESRLTKNVP